MKIKLGTFNLFQFVEPPYSWYNKKDKFNKGQWFQKTTWIKNQILKMDCDIIGFQEVFSQDALKVLVKDLGFNYFETVDVAKLSINNPYKYVTTTVALASKYPIVNIEEVKVDMPSVEKHYFEGAFEFSRIPIKATISLPNEKELLVYVCHLKSNRLNEFEYIFNKQHRFEHKRELLAKALDTNSSEALRQRLCEASSLFFDIEKAKNRPIVLLCDLNDKEFSLTIDALSNHKYHDDKSLENFVLGDASYHYKEEKRKVTSYFRGEGNVLDYIFISNDLRENVTNYVVLDEHLQEKTKMLLLKSDHAQVVCELIFRSSISS
jgi:endonuclease/exonuclease/phosphatase family metal-dependent hydrolase